MLTLEEAIEKYKRDEKVYRILAHHNNSSYVPKKIADEYKQLADWLRELQERRKADSCEGCKNIGLWENEYEYGVSCPCLRCARRVKDNYEPERRTDK